MFLWIKAFHLIAVVTWFAALFYLPRLFVYHAMTDTSDITGTERFKVMERKLLNGIMTPSMIAAIALGVWMIMLAPDYMTQGWMHAKLAFVILLIGYHHWCMKIVKTFKNDSNTRSHRWYRWFNEVPVIGLVAISILVIVKPF